MLQDPQSFQSRTEICLRIRMKEAYVSQYKAMLPFIMTYFVGISEKKSRTRLSKFRLSDFTFSNIFINHGKKRTPN